MNFGSAQIALYGWLAQGLLLAALAATGIAGARARGWRLPEHVAPLLCLCAGIAAFLPLPPVGDLAAWSHGVLGAPSFTLVQLALLRVLGRPLPPPPGRGPGALLLLLALLFYLTALGLGPLDPYGWGFHPHFLFAALLPLFIFLYQQRQGGWLLILSLDLMAYTLGLYGNLWDALFDPLLPLILALHLARKKVS